MLTLQSLVQKIFLSVVSKVQNFMRNKVALRWRLVNTTPVFLTKTNLPLSLGEKFIKKKEKKIAEKILFWADTHTPPL